LAGRTTVCSAAALARSARGVPVSCDAALRLLMDLDYAEYESACCVGFAFPTTATNFLRAKFVALKQVLHT
jgi:hypothetical protein